MFISERVRLQNQEQVYLIVFYVENNIEKFIFILLAHSFSPFQFTAIIRVAKSVYEKHIKNKNNNVYISIN